MAFRFDAATNIQRALELDDRVVEALKAIGLKCVDRNQEMCVAAAVETLGDAARYHGIPLDRILSALDALGIPEPREPAGPAP